MPVGGPDRNCCPRSQRETAPTRSRNQNNRSSTIKYEPRCLHASTFHDRAFRGNLARLSASPACSCWALNQNPRSANLKFRRRARQAENLLLVPMNASVPARPIIPSSSARSGMRFIGQRHDHPPAEHPENCWSLAPHSSCPRLGFWC